MADRVRVLMGNFGRAALLSMHSPLVLHAHAQRHLLLNIEGAPSRFAVAGRELPLTQMSAVSVNAWEPHWYPHPSGSDGPLVLALYLNEEWLAERALPLGSHESHVVLRSRDVRLASQMRVELISPDASSPRRLDAIAEELLPPLLPQAVVGKAAIDPRIARAMLDLKHLRGKKPDFSALARGWGLSRPHFFALFRRDAGLSPLVFWNALRMERALTALATLRCSVADLADELGFAEQATFTRFFAAHQGVGPGAYRRAVLRLAT